MPLGPPKRDNPNLPLSWAKFGASVEGARFPSGPFAPAGAWDMTWRILVTVGAIGGGAAPGLLCLKRRPNAGGARLSFETRVSVANGQQFVATGILDCRVDALATLTSWEMDSVMIDVKSGPIESTRIREHGTTDASGAAVERNGRAFQMATGSVTTSNWGLFDAVQRLDPGAAPPPFDMIEDLTLMRRAQSIVSDASRDITLAGTTVKLRSFRQLGAGVLPTHYWLDEDDRLVFVSCGLRGYLLESVA